MAIKPILFSGPMVSALLEGRKTQTRRVLKPEPFVDENGNLCSPRDGGGYSCWGQGTDGRPYWKSYLKKYCRFQIPDLLWVREAFSYDRLDVDRDGILPPWFWADGNPEHGDWTKPKPSIHMPRKFSRLTLQVTAIKVEQLNDISPEDAVAEGMRSHGPNRPQDDFRALWESINGAYSWAANPWVVALTFTVHKCNVDKFEAAKEAA